MKILFICGSVEPGKDGVGDYTRLLCGELIKSNHQVQILSLCDNQISSFSSKKQEVDGIKIMVHRIAKSASYKVRFILSNGILTAFKPDWISLQFVPYSFNPKGLPLWLPFFLNKLKGNHKWHIMFHELWIGIDFNATFTSKCIGLLQKSIILQILKRKEGFIINTQTELYRSLISDLGYQAKILPLISNIIKNNNSHKEEKLYNFEFKFCLFGGIHHGSPVEKFIEDLKFVCSQSNEIKAFKFIFIGNSGDSLNEWKNVLSENKINFEITGFINDDDVSDILSNCQYGISTTPYILNQKSGSLAAMLDHRLSVLCVAREWFVKGFEQKPFLNLIKYENKESVNDFLNRKFIASDENNIEFVTLRFINGLN